jgi:hypothetical protein
MSRAARASVSSTSTKNFLNKKLPEQKTFSTKNFLNKELSQTKTFSTKTFSTKTFLVTPRGMLPDHQSGWPAPWAIDTSG